MRMHSRRPDCRLRTELMLVHLRIDRNGGDFYLRHTVSVECHPSFTDNVLPDDRVDDFVLESYGMHGSRHRAASALYRAIAD